MSEEVLSLLRADYEVMQEKLRLLKVRLREKYRLLEAAEFDREAELVKREFAVRFVRAREAGVRRSDLAAVLRTNDGVKFKEFIELGGGRMKGAGRPSGAVPAGELGPVGVEQVDRFDEVKASAGFEAEWVSDWSFNYHGLLVELVWEGDRVVPRVLNPEVDPFGVWQGQLMLPRRLDLFTEYGRLLSERGA